MGTLFSRKNSLFKFLVFCGLLVFNSGMIFHSLAQNYDAMGEEIFGRREEWCPSPNNPGLSTVCGTVRSATLEMDVRGNQLPNVPLENITVAIFEENPRLPTGKFKGTLGHLFASTHTNRLGQFNITMRKTSPPNKMVHIFFMCQGVVVEHKKLESWHDYWNYNIQIDCPSDDPASYLPPQLPFSYNDRSEFLGCDTDPTTDVPTGTALRSAPTVNTNIREENYDHRHTVTYVSIDVGFRLGAYDPNINFNSLGGWWEPDCLIRPGVYFDSATSGDEYYCHVEPSDCINNWQSVAYSGGQLGDTSLCDGGGPMQRQDYLTRPFFNFIPKTTTALPYRRLDVRTNLSNFMQDPLIPLQNIHTLFGSAGPDPRRGSHVFLRKFGEDDTMDSLIDCEEFRRKNNPTPLVVERNRFLNIGPATGLKAPNNNLEDLYYSGEVDLEKEVCIYDQRPNQPIVLCEIQPTWLPVRGCEVGTSGCNDPRTPCGDFVLPHKYFPDEKGLKESISNTGVASFSPNDSQASGKRGNEFFVFETEGDLPYQTQSRVTKPIDKSKFNTETGLLSATDIDQYVTDAEPLMDSLKCPFCDDEEDYYDLMRENWSVYGFGTDTRSLCSIPNPYQFPVDGPADELGSVLKPDNTYQGNVDHIAQIPAGTGTWYMSEEAVEREIALRDRGLGVWVGSLLGSHTLNVTPDTVDAVMRTPLGRDVWDSLLSIIGGDTTLHGFNFSMSALLNVTASIASLGNSNTKTFGDRDPNLFQSPNDKPYYDVTYPLSEDNFMTYFNLPSVATDPLDPSDWGTGHTCYPFFPVLEGERCDTFREEPDGISRTCRVDDCEAFWQRERATCTCTNPLLDSSCSISNTRFILENGSCGLSERLECAVEQETTSRDGSGVPHEINPSHPNYNNTYDPPGLTASDCTTSDVTWPNSWFPPGCTPGTPLCFYVGGAQSSTITGGRGLTKPRCDVSRAGPLQGGPACNGQLDITDPALRFVQEPALTTDQVDMDNTTIAAYKLYTALRPPGPSVGGVNFAEVDGLFTNDLPEATGDKGGYSYGAEAPVLGGFSNIPEIKLVSTAPVFMDVYADPLRELNYHCNFEDIFYGGGISYVLTSTSMQDEVDQSGIYGTFDPDYGGGIDCTNPTTPAEASMCADPLYARQIEPGWYCPIYPPPDPHIITLPDTPGSCGIQPGRLASCQAHPSVPDELSQTFIDTVNLAANEIGIPAAAILAVTASEGGFNPAYDRFWSDDDTVYRFGVPWYGQLHYSEFGNENQCNELVWTAQGPFQILQSTFEAFLHSSNVGPVVCDVLENLSTGRCKTASRCNLFDSSLIVAKHLKPDPPLPNCASYNDATLTTMLGSYGGGEYGDPTSGAMTNARSVFNACR